MENNNYPTEPLSDQITSGNHLPYWLSGKEAPLVYSSLNRDITTDILVIGGGIAGLTTAYCLAKEGKKVTLVEDGFIGSGETGRTTAHLTCALDDRYYSLESMFDENTAQLAANSHMAAIEWIANTIKLNDIDCHFKRVDGYLFLHSTDTKDSLDKEYAATKRAGLITTMLDYVPSVSAEEGKWSIQFHNQAQFHILLYLKGLAAAFTAAGGNIYTNTRATKINKEGAEANGFTIKADHIVVATNTPVNNLVTMHTKQWPYRSYVIAAKVPKGSLPYSLWWDTGDQESKWVAAPYHYVRLEEFDDQYDLLISGGEDHRTGQADEEDIKEEDRYVKLEEWTRKRFPMIGNIEYRWSGQVMEPVDSLGFIGKNPGDENIYIITGDSGNGMTHGTLGGIILTDIINGRENPWTNIYNPSRVTMNTAHDFLQEAGNMVSRYADWVKPADIKTTNELKPGNGAILSNGLKKVAIYRDDNNNLHTCTAICPHLGGILQWNADEKTFDCPIHGSRFTTEGKVINGPASADLKKVELEE